MVYQFGVDHKLRPIVIVNVLKVIQTRITEPNLLRLSYWVLNTTIQQRFCLGKVETWFTIFDMNNV
jgi:hypothetical protein